MLEKSFTMVAKTSFGLEEVAAEELTQLGAQQIEKGIRSVSFKGDKTLLYNANLWLRTVNKILVPIHQFPIKDSDDLYNQIKKMEWENIFDVDQTFFIDAVVSSTLFNHSQFPALKAKDAIADRFREKFNRRPNVEKINPNIKINLYINQKNVCVVSLDSSGDALFKRGYRESRSEAPIKEDLAAGMILLSGWDKKAPLLDLFCGSGTILIEAAMIAFNIAPNLKREEFGFFNWKDFDNQLFNKLKEEAIANRKFSNTRIIGVDNSGRVLGMCRANLKSIELLDKVSLKLSDFQDYTPSTEPGIIISNPPYGERIGDGIEALYTDFGDTLKQKFSGWSAWIISSNMDALKNVGLRPSKKLKLFNGSLECKFVQYEMYQGTKKTHKTENAVND